MKIGICFSGQLRAGVWATPAIKSFIGNLWDDCDFFFHTWDSQYFKNYSSKAIQDLSNLTSTNINYVYTDHVNWKQIDFDNLTGFMSMYKPKMFLIEDYNTTAKTLDDFRNGFLTKHNLPNNRDYFPSAMYYSYYRSVEMLRQHEQTHGVTYDVIVKLRPDVIFPMDVGNTGLCIADLKEDIENVLANPNVLYKTSDLYWISTGDNIKRLNSFWEESFKRIDVTFWSHATALGVDIQPSPNGTYTILRNLWKRAPVDDFFMMDTLERFFLELPPNLNYLKNPGSNAIEQTMEKLKFYVQNYGIIEELCNETGYTVNK
jgi:hypothetical protein